MNDNTFFEKIIAEYLIILNNKKLITINNDFNKLINIFNKIFLPKIEKFIIENKQSCLGLKTKSCKKENNKKINGWNLFQKENYKIVSKKLSEENKDTTFSTVIKILSKLWSNNITKVEYNNKAKIIN